MGTFLRTAFVATVVTALAFAVVGCKSTTTGNEGNFQFSYWADDDVRDFNKPIAVGGKLDIQVNDVEKKMPVTLSSASFDKPEVLTVDGFTANTVTVKGTGTGGALLTVEGKAPGAEQLMDSVNLLARVPEVVKLGHSCTVETEATYLTNQRILIPFELEMNNGQPVIGYGYYPVTIEPPTGVVMDPDVKAQQWFHVDTDVNAGTVSITSDLDDAAITAVLVDAASIDGAIFPIGENIPLEKTEVRRKLYHILPTVGGNPVCQALTDVVITVDTPEICEVSLVGQRSETDEEGLEKEQKNEYGWLDAMGLEVGECQFTATYTAGAGGEGSSTQLSLTVIE